MDNTFIKAQCANMTSMLESFMASIKLSATQDDGKVSKDEQKALKQIEKAVGDLEKVLNKYV